MDGVSSGCGLCPWSCLGKVGAYVHAAILSHNMHMEILLCVLSYTVAREKKIA